MGNFALRVPRAIALAMLFVAAACSSEAGAPANGESATVASCAAGELRLNGACERTGVPPTECGTGFAPDDAQGCRPILPADACPKGQMAVPGDAECRPVATCADGDYGDIPVDGSTVFVNLGYTGGGNDGTRAHPFTTVQEGIDRAPRGGIVAIAAGRYEGSVFVNGKGVRLFGRCPELVEIIADDGYSGIAVTSAPGTEIHALAVRRGAAGIDLRSVKPALLDRVWVHDTGLGIYVQRQGSTTSVTVRGSLVELAKNVGIVAGGAEIALEASVVRDTQPDTDRTDGEGLQAGLDAGEPSNVHVTGSLFERNHTVGLFANGSVLTVEDTVVRDTLAQVSDKTRGLGIAAHEDAYVTKTNKRSTLTVARSVVQNNTSVGIYVTGSDASITHTVVRDTQPEPRDGLFGAGIVQVGVPAAASKLTLTDSVVANNYEVGVQSTSAEAILERVIVRDSQAQVADTRWGVGVAAQTDQGASGSISLTACLVERSVEAGIQLDSVTASLDRILVRDTAGGSSLGGGDGVHAGRMYGAASDVRMQRTRVERSARAGLANFGATMRLSTTTLECNPIAMDAERVEQDAVFENLEGNTCSCGAETTPCAVRSSQLAPPEQLPKPPVR